MSKNPKTDLQKDLEKKMRKILIDYADNNIDMSELCSYMYLAVVQKYMYDCYQVQEIGVFTPKEWLQWQLSRGRLAILSDVVEGMNPTEFEEKIRDNFPSFFEGQRGAYDSFPEEMKELTT